MSDDWKDDYPSETVMAVPLTDTTAGIQVTLYDFDEIGDPPMIELHQYYPDEDEQDGESVYLHGTYATLQLLATVADLYSGRFEEAPYDE